MLSSTFTEREIIPVKPPFPDNSNLQSSAPDCEKILCVFSDISCKDCQVILALIRIVPFSLNTVTTQLPVPFTLFKYWSIVSLSYLYVVPSMKTSIPLVISHEGEKSVCTSTVAHDVSSVVDTIPRNIAIVFLEMTMSELIELYYIPILYGIFF